MESKLAGKNIKQAKVAGSKGGKTEQKGDDESRVESTQPIKDTRKLQALVNELQLLYESSLAISALRDPREIGDAIVHILTDRMDWHHITVRRYEPETDQLILLSFAQPGIKNEKEYAEVEKYFNDLISKPGQGLTGWAFQHGVSVRSGNVAEDPRFVHTYPGLKSGLYVPIKIGDKPIGMISIESETENAFDESDERLLATIATQAAVVIENARLVASARSDLQYRIQIEKELRESEKKYRLLAENASDVIWVLDLETYRFNYVSPSIIHLRGYTAEEAMNQTMEESISPASGQYIFSVLPKRIADFNNGVDQHYTDEFEHPCKDGSTVWSETTSKFHVNSENGHLEVYGVSHNITERKKAEEELLQSNNLYRLLAENSTDGVTLFSGAGKLLYISPAYARMLGYKDEDLKGIGLPDILSLIHPEDKKRIETMIKRGRELRLPTSQYEFRVRKKDGEYIWIEDSLRREFDEEGQVKQIIVNSREITARKKMDETLRQSEERYRSLVAGMLDGVYRSTHDGKFMDVNPAMVRMFGYENREEMLSLDIKKDLYFAPEDRESLFLDTGQEKVDVFRMRRKDGTEIWVEDHGRYVHDEQGNVIYHEGILRDVTERVQAEEKLKQSEELYRSVVSVLSEGLVVQDLNDKILMANESAARILGLTMNQLLGKDSYDPRWQATHEDGSPFKPEDHPSVVTLRTGQPVDNTIMHVNTGDGHRVIVAINSRPIHDETGEITGVVVSFSDITERKRAEQALWESEESLQEAQRVANVGNWQWRMATDDVIWSKELYRICGLDPNLPAPNFTQLKSFYTPESWERLSTAVNRSIQTGEPYHLELETIRTDGTILFTSARGEADYDASGNVIGLHGTVQDVSDRKLAELQIEEQLRRLNALRTIEIAIKSSFDINNTLAILLEQVTSQLRVDAASVLLFNENTLSLEYTASRGFHSLATRHTQLKPGEGYAGQILLDRKIIHIPDLHKAKNKLTHSLQTFGEDFTAYVGVPLIAKGQIVGVLEIFQRNALNPTPDWFDFLEVLSDEAAIAIDNAQLFESLQRSNFELTLAYDATIEGWSRALDLRDRETEGHTKRVTTLTVKLSQQMGIPNAEILHIRRGALLHDIGKMGIPDKILFKADSLTDEEWATMRQHTIYAGNMLSPINYLRPALDIPLYHHEKWDGSGYPYKLEGEQIPLAARIFAVVDVWDALTSERPYRKAWTEEQTIEYIKEQSGRHFDPKVVDAFLQMRAMD